MIDCEGCVDTLFRGTGKPLLELLSNVDTIILEGDMPVGAPDCLFDCVDYLSWHMKFSDAGLTLVEEIQDDLYVWIKTYVYKRRALHLRRAFGVQ
jgi:hypothetical protein